MTKGSFELSVSIHRDGRLTPLREFGHNGNTYIESRDGTKFTLKFKNNRAHRVLIVPSIDCISVLEGSTATPQSRGYIVPAYSSVEIKGWRTSLEDINDFVFEKKESGKTYAEGTGNDTANCGVIGVKVFDEKIKTQFQQIQRIVEEHHHHHHHNEYWPLVPDPIVPRKYPWTPYQPYWCSTSKEGGINQSGEVYSSLSGHDSGPMLASSLNPDLGTVKCMNSVAAAEFTSDQTLGARKLSLTSATPQFDMGTGFGAHQKDKVSEEQFERDRELETLLIHYASAKSLAEIGIDVEKKVTVNVMPQAFQSGFCKAPVTR